MDRALAGQARYLAALDDAARAEPFACANQLAALARERALVAGAAGVVAYREASGELFELARGAWLDRLVGHARSAAAVDDPWAVAAARIELDAALAARDAAAWGPTLIVGSVAAATVRAVGAEAVGAYATLQWAVVRARAEGRGGDRAEAEVAAAAAGRRLRAIDAGFDPRALAPRYRWRTPWTGAGLDAMAGWIAAVAPAGAGARAAPPDGAAELAAIDRATAAWRASLPGRGGGPTTGTAPTGGFAPCPTGEAGRVPTPHRLASLVEPTAAEVVTPYVGLARLAGDVPEVVALRDAARALIEAAAAADTAQEVLAIWTERGLLVALARAPVLAGLERVRARLADWPEPLLAHHARAVAAELSGSRTTTTVDLASVHAGACLAIEADWNRALVAGVLAPVRAASIATWDPSADARRGIAAAWSVAHALAGAGADLDRVPWVERFVRELIVRHAGGDPGALGGWQGEAGVEVVGDARTAIAVARAGGQLAGLDQPGFVTWLRGRWGAPPPAAAGSVRLWDREVALADLTELVAAPARPPSPGKEPAG